jgi:hypothetical protein
VLIEILSLAAALEWIALGVLTFFKLRSMRHRMDTLLDEMKERIADLESRCAALEVNVITLLRQMSSTSTR